MTQQQTKNKEFESFSYIIVHDLKSPLRSIQTLTEWITRENSDRLTESGKEHLELIQSRVKRMDDILDSISEYYRIGRDKAETESVDLNQLVDNIIILMRIPDHIKCKTMKSLPVVQCRKNHIKQVFKHLIENAVQFMDKSDGKIDIDCCKENEFWKFSIADNGPGIKEEYHERIFKIFQTLETKDDTSRKGMGLTFSRKIIELTGGRIWLKSKKNEGSTFFFTLPRTEK